MDDAERERTGRPGDRGHTSILAGKRVRKDDPAIEACGAIDEASSFIGLARAAIKDQWLDSVLAFAQMHLGACAAYVSSRGEQQSLAPTLGEVRFLEEAAARMRQRSAEVSGLLLPGGSEAAARLDVARSVARRAERRSVAVLPEGQAHPALTFLNRLSDLLFAAARYANHLEGVNETPWRTEEEPTAE